MNDLSSGPSIIIIAISLIFSAIFSGMEIAFLSSNKLKFELEKKASIADRIIAFFFNHRSQYISTILVGNNLSLVIYGIITSGLLTPWLNRFIPNTLVSTLIHTILATLVILVTGEFLPKNIFRVNPNLWLRLFAPLIFVFYRILYPITFITSSISKGLLRLVGIKFEDENKTVFNRIDLSHLVLHSDFVDEEEGTEHTIKNDVQIFQNALDFSSIKLRDCIVPRTDVMALDKQTMTLGSLRQAFTSSGFSKILVYEEDMDHIVGYFHAADMFKTNSKWKNNLREIPFLPETMAANKLMSTFIQSKKSIAVVVDEFGGTAGIVTLEDLMEEIFGEIEDEHDNSDLIFKKISDTEYKLSGRVEIDQINQQLGLKLPEDESYQTIAGYILQNNQRLPKQNDTIEINSLKFRIDEAHNNRIDLITLYL